MLADAVFAWPLTASVPPYVDAVECIPGVASGTLPTQHCRGMSLARYTGTDIPDPLVPRSFPHSGEGNRQIRLKEAFFCSSLQRSHVRVGASKGGGGGVSNDVNIISLIVSPNGICR